MSKLNKKAHEPWIRIAKRSALVWWQSYLIRIAAVVLALLFCAGVSYLLTKENPIALYTAMFEGVFGTSRRMWKLAQNVAMLLCVSLAVTPAFRMRFWNTGAEGQVLIGGLATAACMILLGNKLSTPMLFVTMTVSAMAAGAIWAIIPAVFKAYWGTNETLFTLMMNYIAIQLVSFFSLQWSVPKGSGQIGVINSSTEAGWFPALGGHKYLLNILIVLVLTIVMYIYLKYSKQGYEIAVVGESEKTARYIGVNVKKVIIRTMLISGVLCGIAGLLLVAGTDHTITRDTAAGRGFTAIMVSWMAQFNPLYMLLTSFLIVFMQQGASEITTKFGLNESFSEILTGIIIFFIIGSEFFIRYSIKLGKKHKEGTK